MAQLVSFAGLLNTGNLGPLRPGMTMNEVAVLLGPPESWLVTPGTGPAPTFWGYGRLEIEFIFESETPYCRYFMLTSDPYMRGDCQCITNDFLIYLDGLNGDSRISDFIRLINDIDSVAVILSDLAGYSNPMMWIGNSIEVIFSSKIDEKMDVEFKDVDRGDVIRALDGDCVLSSIFTFYYANDDSRLHNIERREERRDSSVSGREYLAALEGA